MIARWIAAHKSLVATVTSGSVVTALVATAAIMSTGYVAQRVDLDDASVWVVNGGEQAVGRANTQVFELDTVLRSESGDVDVVQGGPHVLAHDRANSTLDVLDPATTEITESIPLPPAGTVLRLSGDDLVVFESGTGALWVHPVDDLASFDPADEPDRLLGPDAAVSLDDTGLLTTFSPESGLVSTIDVADGGTVVSSATVEIGEVSDDFSATSVRGRWAVLDATAGTLTLEGRVVSLAGLVPAGAAPALQSAASTGDRVLVAYQGGLVGVPLDGGDPQVLVDDVAGGAAEPMAVAGCELAAWSDGSVWRSCDGGDPERLELESVPGGADLAFVRNGDRAVLSDPLGGSAWAVLAEGQLIDNWTALIEQEQEQEQVDETESDVPPELDPEQQPPVAVDDEVGVRAGRANTLQVLLNDYDANGDVLVIAETSPIDEAVGRLDVVAEGQRLQLTLEPRATGVVTFTYTVTDGRGGSATATVRATVRAPDENQAPQQVRTSRAAVEQSGQVSTPVLGDWVDPDSDPIYLTTASVPAPDIVTWEPSGVVLYRDLGGGGSARVVSLVVSDGRDSGSGRLEVSVRPRGEVPLVADDFAVSAYVGDTVEITPLQYARGGSGRITLNAVPAKTGSTIVPSFESGTFTFTSDQVRTHYLEYVVTDGELTATGRIRIDVSPRPDANLTPITLPKTVFVRSLSSETIEVATVDVDPAQGVLVVTGLSGIAQNSGVRGEVLEQSRVRVTLTAPLDGPVSFTYRITNGFAEAEGTVTVVEIPAPDRLQPPIARDDAVSVRVGDVIDIPVLANDEQPDGRDLTLAPRLVREVSEGGGLLFASDSRLRYLAPDAPGVFSAVYEVSGPSGQTAQAEVRITVREADAVTNAPPVPRRIDARVLAGETVRIEVPLSGIDPDGDSVQLLGQETNPEKGAVLSVESNVIEYEAGDYSAGTDSFTYTVIDALGARATGTVRVGISPRIESARNPVAIEDEVRVRPGGSLAVQVLANDSDPDGGTLRVTGVEPNDPRLAAVVEDDEIVRITVPDEVGVFGLVYAIENDFGGTSSNFIRLIVDENAPLAFPIARDTVLTLSDVLDRETVDVSVLSNVFFAEGDVGELGLSVLPGYGRTAEVTNDKRIRVRVTDESQIIPFAVAHPDDASVRSFAFVWVPGLDDALPQIDRSAPPLEVRSEQPLTIELSEYVVAVAGRTVRLTDTSTVRATHANGESLVVDDTTLRFVSADRYFGPASISFEVTDGTSASDPQGRTATLVLPIRVEPRDNQPPAFKNSVIEFEPAQQKSIDLVRLTDYPSDDVDELAYTVLSPLPEGFTFELVGQRLVLRADEAAAKGSSTSITLGVADAVNEGRPGRIQLDIVPSTRPLASPAADQALVRRGETTTIDVLANDEATNPFPGEPLQVVAIRGLDGGRLPAGVTVQPSADRSRLTVRVDAAAATIDTTLQYQLADATNDPERTVWGTFTISVQDVPDAPAAPVRQGATVGGELTVRLSPPAFNNSAITGYRVISTEGDYSFDCGLQTICSLEGLDVARPYRFQVIAENGIGPSAPSAPSEPFTVDFLPAAPTAVSAVPTADDPDGGDLRISWNAVPTPSPGSAVEGYTVLVSGAGISERVSVGAGTTSISTSARGFDLPPNAAFEVTVFARNSAQLPADSPEWLRTTIGPTVTVGPPSPVAPAPTAAINSANTEGEVVVSWGSSDPNGAGSVSYSVGRVDGAASAPACSPGSKPDLVSGARVSSPWTDTSAEDGGVYTYIVYADNGLYCTASTTQQIESKRPPGQASGALDLEQRDGDSAQWDLRAIDLAVASGQRQKFQYSLNGGPWIDVPGNGFLTSTADPSVYGVQQNVVFRGCRDTSDLYCGAASAPVSATPVNTRAAGVTCLPGQLPQPAAPAAGGPQEASYLFDYDRGGILTDYDGFDDDATVAVPEPDDFPGATGIVQARVRASVVSGGVTYVDPGFAGDFTCNG